jgi:hypothetical protein
MWASTRVHNANPCGDTEASLLNPRSRRAALDVEHGGRNTNADVAYLFRPLESDGRQVRRLLRFRRVDALYSSINVCFLESVGGRA